jgi:hypothetical protein
LSKLLVKNISQLPVLLSAQEIRRLPLSSTDIGAKSIGTQHLFSFKEDKEGDCAKAILEKNKLNIPMVIIETIKINLLY